MHFQRRRMLSVPWLIEAFYGGVLRDLRERGYSHSIRSELHVKLLDQTTAVASTVFVHHKTDGSELESTPAQDPPLWSRR
jgi:hypothetical protein